MPDTLPSSIYASQIPGKGRGLFTTQAIEAGELVFLVDRPLVCMPSNPHLDETCYQCFMWLPSNTPRPEDDARRLQSCMGCKVVKYCSKVSEMLVAGSARLMKIIYLGSPALEGVCFSHRFCFKISLCSESRYGSVPIYFLPFVVPIQNLRKEEQRRSKGQELPLTVVAAHRTFI